MWQPLLQDAFSDFCTNRSAQRNARKILADETFVFEIGIKNQEEKVAITKAEVERYPCLVNLEGLAFLVPLDACFIASALVGVHGIQNILVVQMADEVMTLIQEELQMDYLSDDISI